MSNDSKVEKNRKPGKPAGSPKSGGRKPGTPNKKTLWLRDELDSVNLSWGQEFKKALDSNDVKKAEILVSILPFLNPKIKDRDVDIEEDESTPETEISVSKILDLTKAK